MARLKVDDVVLDGPAGGVPAYVVEPGGRTPKAGVLFAHWLGEDRSDRTQFLAEARRLAGAGVRSVLPAGRLPWEVPPSAAEADAAAIETEIGRLGQALDALAAGLPAGAPLAFVGHDFGAMAGSIVAARTGRLAAVVLIALSPRWGDWFLPFWPIAGDRHEYLRRLAPLDPIEAVRSIRAPLLFQFSRPDFYISGMTAIELARAAPGEPTVEWYAADHAMRSPRARASRRAFLERALQLG